MKIRVYKYGFAVQIVRCMYCKKITQINLGCQSWGTSHGLCPDCNKKEMKKIRQYLAKKSKEDQ